MIGKRRLALYGLKWNPFSPDIPIESCQVSQSLENFFWRVENLTHAGGFAMITGDPGLGKSVALRLLDRRLSKLTELTVGKITRPQSSMADFYREVGEVFGLQLSPANRWRGTKLLRERWRQHIDTTLKHAVLLIDEAQEMKPQVLNELRLLCSTDLDSRTLLTVVLSGDGRLQEKLRSIELLPLGSRIRVRETLKTNAPLELESLLRHVLEESGNGQLMTKGLISTLCQHAAGNLRILMMMANEMLDMGLQLEREQLDEKLYLEIYSSPRPKRPEKKSKVRSRRR